MVSLLQQTVYLDCDPDKLMRWALETAGVSAPPRTITRTTWQLLHQRVGEHGCTPEQCLTWLLAQYPSVYELTLDGQGVVRATNVSYQLQQVDAGWRNPLKLNGAIVPDLSALGREVARSAKRTGKAITPERPPAAQHVGRARIKAPNWKPVRRPEFPSFLAAPLATRTLARDGE